MKKILIISVLAISLLSASCDLFNNSQTGVLKTSNGGIDWQSANQMKDSKETISNLSITKLAFDPIAPGVMYASSTNSGLYKSSDGATTWEQILGQIPVVDFAINPTDSNNIFVGGYIEGRGRALVTKDGGKSWNAIYTSADTDSSVRSIAINPNNTAMVAIGLSQGELIVSNDSGATWRLVQSYNDRVNQIIWQNNNLYVLVRNTGVYWSTDNGVNFQLITSNLRTTGNTAVSSIFGGQASKYNHVAVSSSNPGLLYITTNLGVFRTTNFGQNWEFINLPLKRDSVIPNVVAISKVSDNAVYVSAGTIIYKTSDSGQTWSASDSGTDNLVNAILIDQSLPQVAYAGISTK